MTLLEFKNQIQEELDLEDEDFIESAEFLSYVNQGIRTCEAHIHKLGVEDNYFLANATLSMVQGTGAYALPADIYATKIRSIQWDSADKHYEIRRFRGTRALSEFLYWRRYGTATTDYKYILTNNAATGPRLELAPLAQTTNTSATIWYIRNAAEMADDADEFDIPEFINFVFQFVRDKCINKERFTMDAPPSPALQREEQLMIDTLTEQVPDGDNRLEADFSHYEEST